MHVHSHYSCAQEVAKPCFVIIKIFYSGVVKSQCFKTLITLVVLSLKEEEREGERYRKKNERMIDREKQRERRGGESGAERALIGKKIDL